MLYTIGLILAILYLLMGLDDFIWDITAIIRKPFQKSLRLDMNDVNAAPEKLIAVIIAAWKEENVLGEVIENFVRSAIYPTSMYHVFLGVYPNDGETLQIANEMADKYENVHVVVNHISGPTSKAQNINYVVHQIKKWENQMGWQFRTFTVHDSEDVIHPYELKVTSYLIDYHKAIQFPVFPLIQFPRVSNFFQNITTATYADEFAENHFLTMVNRSRMGAFVPSAGTGFSLTREVVDSFADGEILPRNSLTEDYRLSLTLYERNTPLHYVLEQIPRVSEQHKIANDFVSTKSMFPKTFKTAVRQKTRWITGITMQSVSMKEILTARGLKFAGRYSLYKDQKAKVGNLLAFIGYPVFIYFLISLFVDLPAIYPRYTLSWYLCLAVTIVMLERQLFRAVSIYQVYGLRSVFFACFFPPLLPLRVIWGNIINFTATIRSYRQKYFHIPRTKKRTKLASIQKTKPLVKWDKTEHAFLEKDILKRYHRKIGDIFIERNFITPKQLLAALQDIHRQNNEINVGSYLVLNGYISEEQLLICLAQLTDRVFLDARTIIAFAPVEDLPYSQDNLEKHKVLPILKKDNEMVVAVSEYTSKKAIDQLIEEQNKTVICFADLNSIIGGISRLSSEDSYTAQADTVIEQYYQQNKLTAQQALLARKAAISNCWDDKNTLQYMGLSCVPQ